MTHEQLKAHHAQILQNELDKKFANPKITEVGVLGSAIVNEIKDGQMTGYEVGYEEKTITRDQWEAQKQNKA
jgi:hypothetical protein